MSSKDRYKALFKEDDIFLSPWWLDLVSSSWDVSLVEKNGELIGVLVYDQVSSKGVKYILTPPLSLYAGVKVWYPKDLKERNFNSFSNKVIDQLIQQLPSFNVLDIKHSLHTSNLMSFYWNGFDINSRYTLRISKYITESQMLDSLSSTVKRKVKSAEPNFRIERSGQFSHFYELYSKSFYHQKKDLIFDETRLGKLIEECVSRNKGDFFLAYDQAGKPVAGALFVWDGNAVYYVLGGVSRSKNQTGAMELLILEGIKLALSMNLPFDFEGSMNQQIFQFFNGFGGELTPYMATKKVNSKVLGALFTLLGK